MRRMIVPVRVLASLSVKSIRSGARRWYRHETAR